MVTFQIEYTDLKTHFYAELWGTKPFQCDVPWSGDVQKAEEKGDERGIGCRFKLDIIVPCWASWEGTLPDLSIGIRKLQIAGAANEAMLDKIPPSPSFRPVRPGVNILRWVDLPGLEPGPEPGPGPNPIPQPDLPPIDDPGDEPPDNRPWYEVALDQAARDGRLTIKIGTSGTPIRVIREIGDIDVVVVLKIDKDNFESLLDNLKSLIEGTSGVQIYAP